MKLFVFLFFLTVVYSQEFQVAPQFQAIWEECAKIEKVDMEMVAKALETMHYPNEKNFKCFLKCNMVKSNHMTETGKLLIDNIKKERIFISSRVSEEMRLAALEACKDVKGEDACETASNLCECIGQQYELLLKEFST